MLWIFDLFADRRAVSGSDNFCQIRIELMVRKARHRHRVVALVAARQCDAKRPGGDFGIVVEQLVEVAHAEEKQRVAGRLLGVAILLHHG